MVEPSQDFFYSHLDVAKIDAYSDFVQFGASDEYFDHPVMPVDPCAVAGVSPQAVSRGKVALYVNFKNSCHRDLRFNHVPMYRHPALLTDSRRCYNSLKYRVVAP